MNREVKEVLRKIKENGFEAYLIGGYPRDHYLGKTTNDYDITTSASTDELKSIFKETKDQKATFGNIMIDREDCSIEITTYRTEKNYVKHRYPKEIIFVKTLEEDLLRRDFIMNTLCMDEEEKYTDLLGAKKDIDEKIIRVVGDADQKIEEDALRILRAIRFATTLNFKLDLGLKKAIKKYKKNIRELSYSRKKKELDQIFSSENVEYGISLLQEFQLEEELEVFGFSNLNPKTNILGIWAQLNFSSKYEFSNSEKKEISILKILLESNILDPFILYTYGHYYCGIVAEIKGISKNEVLEVYKKLPIHHPNEVALTPKELQGLVSRETIKMVCEDLEKQILQGNLENYKVFLKKYVIQKYNGRKD